MRTWAVCQEKGGVGKTILTLNLGTYAVSRGEKVLIIDLDTQNSAAFWSKTREDAGAANGGPSVLGVSPERLPDVVKLAAEMDGSLVLVDTPSRLDTVALAAIRQADLVLCPCVPGLLSFAPLQKTVELIKGADKLSATIGILNNVEQGAGVDKRIAQARTVLEEFGMAVAATPIFHLGQFSIAYDKGLAVSEMPDNKAARQIQSLWNDLNKLASKRSKVKGARA